MHNHFARGVELGKMHLTAIQKKGKKWHTRHIPIFIRENLICPYYITENSDLVQELFVIQMPIRKGDKVCFLLFAQRIRDENNSQIPYHPEP